MVVWKQNTPHLQRVPEGDQRSEEDAAAAHCRQGADWQDVGLLQEPTQVGSPNLVPPDPVFVLRGDQACNVVQVTPFDSQFRRPLSEFFNSLVVRRAPRLRLLIPVTLVVSEGSRSLLFTDAEGFVQK